MTSSPSKPDAPLITKRLHISGLTPAIDVAALKTRLAPFGTVAALDAPATPDALGRPRPFAYATMTGTKESLAKCVNVLSGSTWKGARLRLGDAKPSYGERLEREHAAPVPPPRKRRRVGAHHAEDMSLVTPANARGRAGWTVGATGRVTRALKIRPARPLPPPVSVQVSKGKEKRKGKGKKKAEMLTRQRRRTIDPLLWGSTYLKGAFLDAVRVVPEDELQPSGDEEVLQETVEDAEDAPQPFHDAYMDDSVTPQVPSSAQPEADVVAETAHSLALLKSLFGADDADWTGRASISGDSDEEDTERIDASAVNEGPSVDEDRSDDAGGEDANEVDGLDEEPDSVALPSPHSFRTADTPSPPPPPTTHSKLKDLFAPRPEDNGGALFASDDLDLDPDFDLDFTFAEPHSNADAPPSSAPPTTQSQPSSAPEKSKPHLAPARTSTQHSYHLPPFFAPLSAAALSQPHTFFRTETPAETRARWERERGELTRGWVRRAREAKKGVRRGRAGAVE